MAHKSLQGVLQQVRRITAVQSSRELNDRELLERFARSNDEAAFTVLVERHGPLVFGVCRRALGSFHDAEDACQATFLLLARKAASIRKTASLGSWLHRVARSVTANMRRERARRARREYQAQPSASQEPASDLSLRELQGALDDELQRLPERYRAPLILCYLNGQTRDEAAGRLGLTPAALHGRLERGRRLLGDRLVRRGLTLSAALTAAAAGEGVSQAALSPSAVVFVTKAATLVASGTSAAGGIVSARVLFVAREALRSMVLSKVKLVAGVVLAAGLSVITVGGMLGRASFMHNGDPGSQPIVAAAERGEPAVDAATNDIKQLQGEWQAVEAERSGKKDSSDAVKDLRMIFTDHEITLTSASGEGRTRKKTFKLDPRNSPKAIDITSLDGQEEGQTAAGVYSLANGRLRLCMPDRVEDPSKRPTEFRTREGDGLMLLVLERVAPKAPGAEIAPGKRAAAEDAKKLQGQWQAVEFEINGKKSAPYEITFTFKGDEITPKGVLFDGKARFKLDAAKSPKAIDILSTGGRTEGLYSLKEDQLILCIQLEPDKRPAEFKTREGERRVLIALQRVRAKGPGAETGLRQLPGATAANEFGAVLREWRQADKEFQDAYWKAKTPDEQRKIMAEKSPKPGPFAERCLKLAEAYPDTAAALAALCWAVYNAPTTEAGKKALTILQDGLIARATPDDLMSALDSASTSGGGRPKQLAPLVLARVKRELDHPRAARLLAWVCTCYMHEKSAEPPTPFAEAADLIVTRFSDSPDINWLCECLGGIGTGCPTWAVQFEKHLRTILKANHHLRVRSTALIALASVLHESGQEEEAMQLYEHFVKEYEKGAPNDPWNGILKELVRSAKRELEGMLVRPLGGPAPAVEGEDLDGRPMKLSDFRGRVVLISFWGSWCGPCMKLVPHERSLVERLKDKPFALVGVNADEDPAELSKALATNPVTWRSFQNKRAGKKTITEEWKILGYPTLYLIDHKGIIRKRWIGAPPINDLDREIDTLIEGAPAEK